jgi:hypothetical protein
MLHKKSIQKKIEKYFFRGPKAVGVPWNHKGMKEQTERGHRKC